MDQPRKILFFHQNTGRFIGALDNRGDKRFWDDIHEQDMDGTNFFNFMMPNSIKFAEKVVGRVRVLIPHEETGWQEFLVHSVEDDGPNREVRTNGAETDLNKLKIIEPTEDVSLTAYQYVELCTAGTIYQPGIIEFKGSRSIDRGAARGAYDFLSMVQNAFDLEIRFRVETSGGFITGRYVDLVERIGTDRAHTVEHGKDLIAFRRIVESNDIVTSLYCQTPERDDGTRITTTVTHAEAFQQWNWQSGHLTGIYEPESDNQEMTLAQLKQYGQTALNKLVASIFEYDVEAVSLEHLFQHKIARLGDRINVKNTDVKPAIYARARVLRVIRSISNPAAKRYIIGEVKEIPEEEVLKTFRQLQNLYGTKLIQQPEAPPVKKNAIWIQTDVPGIPFGIGHTANSEGTAWVSNTATNASDINAVDTTDFNGMKLMELLNAPDVTARLLAGKLQLVGAVEVLSDITGNLGTITAGKMQVLQIEGGDKRIVFGASLTDFDGRIDYADSAMRFQSDGSTYIKVNRGGANGLSATNVSSSALVQVYGAGAPMFNMGYLEPEFMHRTISGGLGRIKFLNGSFAGIQFRNLADTEYIEVGASEFTVGSVRSTKKNIEDYAIDALTEIMTTPVHTYHLLEDSDNEKKRIGLIYDEVPADIANVAGNGVDIYAMATMSWRALQQLKEEKDAEIAELKSEMQEMKEQMLQMQQAIAQLQGSGAAQ